MNGYELVSNFLSELSGRTLLKAANKAKAAASSAKNYGTAKALAKGSKKAKQAHKFQRAALKKALQAKKISQFVA